VPNVTKLYKTLNILYSLFYSDCNEHKFPKPILPWAKPNVKGAKAMQGNFVNKVKLCCSIKLIKLSDIKIISLISVFEI